MFFSGLLSHSRLLVSIVLILSTISCIYIPYPVPAEVKHIEISSFHEDAILTLGPRDLLADVAESITETDSNIEVIDGELFRDTAFPVGDWSLHKILLPETCGRINEQLDTDYLVLVRANGVIVGEEKGFNLPILVMTGAMVADEEITIEAMLLDLRTGESVCQISSEAHGTEKMIVWIIVAVGTGPLTESSAITGLGEEIANVIREHAKSEKVRIAIMSVENLEVEATDPVTDNLLLRYNEGDNSYELLTQLALYGTTEPLEQQASKGDIKAAIYLYELTGISGPLDKLAEEGDQQAIAHKSGVQTSVDHTHQQTSIIVERSAKERKLTNKEKELESELTKQAEEGDPKAQFELYMLQGKTKPEWLCRSVDQGYTSAEMWLGYVFETGTYGFPLDYTQSYVWYRRAAIGEQQQEIDKTIKEIKEEVPKFYICKGTSCDIAQKIVDLEGKLSTEKLSTAEVMLKQWVPGDCKRRFVDTKVNN